MDIGLREFEIICSDFGTNGKLSGSLSKDKKNKLSMNGRVIYNFCQEKIPHHINSFIKKNNISFKNIDCFLLHQASKAIIMAIRKKLILKSDKVPFESEFIGNTVSSSIHLLLEKIPRNSENKNNANYKYLPFNFMRTRFVFFSKCLSDYLSE